MQNTVAPEMELFVILVKSVYHWCHKELRSGWCGVPGYVSITIYVYNLFYEKHTRLLIIVFSEAPFGKDLYHVGASQHDLNCELV